MAKRRIAPVHPREIGGRVLIIDYTHSCRSWGRAKASI